MSGADDIELQAAHWLARRDGEAWSAAQQLELDAWINAATAHRIAFLRLSSVWQRAERLVEVVPAAPARGAWLGRFSRWRIAAALVLACGAGWLTASLTPLSASQAPAQHYATAVGESKTLALADGTRVTLNTGTGVRARVGAGTREVWLDSGEAFFDVAHDSAHPFIVDAGRSRITVVGTRFSVRRDGANVSVVVAEGKVRVAQGDKQVTLVRNDSLLATDDRIVLSQKTPVQLENLLGWREGRLMLDELTLAQAAAEFNRYNRRQLVIADPVVATMVIGGSFAPTNVDGFARLLQQGFGLQVRSGPDQIIISR
jgi:transmembrane sensor